MAVRPWGLRKCCGCIWFKLSDPATEDAIYDSYAMRKFTGIDFMTEAVPDETTLSSLPNVSDNAIDWERCMENRKSSVK